MEKSNKVFKIAILILSIFLIAYGVAITYYSFFVIDYAQKYDMEVTVGNKIGFDVSTDILKYGAVPPGGEAYRKLEIKNEREYPVEVSIKFKGDLASWSKANVNNFKLDTKEKKQVQIDINVPTDAELGKTYKGKATIIFKKV